MRVRIVSAVLACSLASGPAFAEGIRASIPGAVERELAAQASQRGRGENPMMVPGLVLIAGGGGLALLGLVYPSGIECKESRTSFDCGTTANKGLLFGGLGAAALGGILIMRGEKQRSSPYIMPTERGVVVGQRLSF